MSLARTRRRPKRRGLADRAAETLGPQAAERTSTERLRCLYKISKLLAAFESVEKTLPRILAVVTRTVALGRAILMVERDSIRSATVWAEEGFDPAGLDAAKAHAEASLKYLIGPASGQPAEPPPADGRSAKRERVVALPLVVDRQRVFGLLQLEGAVLDELDLGFVNAVANQLSIALQRDHAQAGREALLEREQAARADAEAANRAKDEFLAVVSHELRTPLTAVVGWVHLLQGGRLNETQTATAVETIRRNAEIQKQLIEDILDVQSIVAGRLRLKMGAVDLAGLIEEVRDSLTPAAATKDIAVVLALEAAPGPTPGDPTRLRQVVWNLLSNAIKFTPEHGHVRIALKDAGQDRVEISVSDDGPGIPPAFLPHVFEHFRQADPSSTRHHGGLGLGLAIAHSIVALHGGSVTAANAPVGHGAVFTLTLPRLAAVKTGAPLRHPDETGPEAVSLDGVRVLVVDDRLDDREVLTRMLEAAGAHVTAASSAAEGIAALERERPHVLLSDVGMPGEDGYTLIRRVRVLPRDRGGLTPAVAITAYPDPGERTLDAGFQAHITKPVDPLDLARAVAGLARAARRKAAP